MPITDRPSAYYKVREATLRHMTQLAGISNIYVDGPKAYTDTGACMIVASVTIVAVPNDTFPDGVIDWAAYMGAAPPIISEEELRLRVVRFGIKLLDTDAQGLFPEFKHWPYRH